MPIYARKPKSNFTPAPQGLHAAVCCDVWEPWTEERKAEWGGGIVDKTRLVWLIEEINPQSSKPYEASQIYTLSLHPKAKLRAHLESWRGRKFTDEELEQFDLERLIGANGQIQIIHNIGDTGDVYANVTAVVPAAKNAAKLRVPDGYVRRKDRVGRDEPAVSATDEEEVPF